MSSYRLSSSHERSLARRSDTGAPTACPACQSSAIVTTEKKPDAGSYWRCESCGEVWNDSRLHATRSTYRGR
jgi:predicted Zn finger-like uncharacterized protein